ncbi:MAG: methyltransferase domain-containing protein [Robiginitalea sp.]
MKLNKEYWQRRYLHHQTGWDLGKVSPPIAAYADQLRQKDLKILLPGAGRGYEAEYLYRKGFKELTIVDIAPYPLEKLRERLPGGFPEARLVESDFFELKKGPFDLVLEHTFFCALPPELRPRYAEKMASLLKAGGKLAGLLFDFPLTDEGPPYGGSREEYLQLFEPLFEIRLLEGARNSIPPRAGRELFFIFEKK